MAPLPRQAAWGAGYWGEASHGHLCASPDHALVAPVRQPDKTEEARVAPPASARPGGGGGGGGPMGVLAQAQMMLQRALPGSLKSGKWGGGGGPLFFKPISCSDGPCAGLEQPMTRAGHGSV